MKKQLLICTNRRLTDRSPSCGGHGADILLRELERLIKVNGLSISVSTITCLGRCSEGPILRLAPGGMFYTQVTPAQLPAILQEAALYFDGTHT